MLAAKTQSGQLLLILFLPNSPSSFSPNPGRTNRVVHCYKTCTCTLNPNFIFPSLSFSHSLSVLVSFVLLSPVCALLNYFSSTCMCSYKFPLQALLYSRHQRAQQNSVSKLMTAHVFEKANVLGILWSKM